MCLLCSNLNGELVLHMYALCVVSAFWDGRLVNVANYFVKVVCARAPHNGLPGLQLAPRH